MKTWSLSPILTSAYLSAMLTSGLAPIRPSVVFAAAINPMAAQTALQNAVSAISGSDWAAPTMGPAVPLAPQVSASIQQPKADPMMTDELMARMIKFANSDGGRGNLTRSVCVAFNLCQGNATLEMKQLETENPEGHFFMISAVPGSKDIVIMKQNADGSLDCFLTDKTYKLRAAAVATAAGAKLITNEAAMDRFNAELVLMAKEASQLPPTGTAVASNR